VEVVCGGEDLAWLQLHSRQLLQGGEDFEWALRRQKVQPRVGEERVHGLSSPASSGLPAIAWYAARPILILHTLRRGIPCIPARAR
jgi:hypothetical protein